jgi:phasin family protein
MFSFTEQFSAATANAKSQLDKQLNKQLSIANEFATTAFDGVQQIIALNVSATKASVEKSSAAARQLLEARDPSEFFKLNPVQAPNFDSLLAYGRELVSIASKTQAGLLEVVKEQIKDATEAGAAAAAKPLSLVGGSSAASAAPAAAPFSAPVNAPVSAPVAAPAAAPAAPAAAPAAKAPAAAVPPAAAAAPIASTAEAEPAAPATVVTPPAPKAVAEAVAEAVAPAQEDTPANKSAKAKTNAAKPASPGDAVSLKAVKK